MRQMNSRPLQPTVNELKLVQTARQAAHDIRSPLSALNMVIGTLEQLCEEKRELLIEALRRINAIADELLSQGRDDVMSMTTLDRTTEVMAASQIELDDLNITLVVKEAMQLKAAEYFNRKVVFQANFEAGGVSVQANEQTLKRVLSNLCNNSVEAGSAVVSVSLMQVGSSVLLSIKDDGAGISQSVLEKLNDRVPTSYGKEGYGNGLGLAHARASIKAMGGSLSMTSRLGVGTTVLIRFAVSDFAASAQNQIRLA